MPGIPRCATPVGASMSLRVGEPTTCPIMATVVLYLRGELRLPLYELVSEVPALLSTAKWCDDKRNNIWKQCDK